MRLLDLHDEPTRRQTLMNMSKAQLVMIIQKNEKDIAELNSILDECEKEFKELEEEKMREKVYGKTEVKVFQTKKDAQVYMDAQLYATHYFGRDNY